MLVKIKNYEQRQKNFSKNLLQFGKNIAEKASKYLPSRTKYQDHRGSIRYTKLARAGCLNARCVFPCALVKS